jgi:quercetin dioxygenase-like cupin family protein
MTLKRSLLVIALVSIASRAHAAEPAASLDPAVVNAKTIRVTFENDRVRVMEATLKPGEKERLHHHPAYVIYVLQGGKTRNHLPDGSVSETEMKAGETIFREPLTHWAENIGTTTMHLILVELKEPR